MKFRRTAPGQETDPLFSLLNQDFRDEWVNTDGLTPTVINTVVWEASKEAEKAVRPTSALLDGSAIERRQRREARRAMAAVVRALPTRHVDPGAVRTDRRAA